MFTIFNTVSFSNFDLVLSIFFILLSMQIITIFMDNLIIVKGGAKPSKSLSGREYLWMTIVTIILMSNLMGLLPSVHGPTVTIWCNFTGALLMFTMIMITSFVYDNSKFFSKVNVLTPSKLLSFFLAGIEFVSFFIRPITLAVRLSANIIAGHVIMSLILFLDSFFSFSIGMFFTLFETFVAFIQTYIFIVLIMMYND